MKPRRVTIKDIAIQAGVSRGTVDRVLHDRGKVAEDVVQKIREAAAALNYTPNLVARSLATQKTYVIGTLLPNPSEDPFWEKPQIGIKIALEEIKDFGVVVEQFHFSLFDPATFTRSVERLFENPPDAILIATEFYTEAKHFFELAQRENIPVVCINTLITEFPTIGYIGQDCFQSGVLAGKLFDISVKNLNGIVTLNVGARAIEKKHLLHKEQGLHYYFDSTDKNIKITEIDVLSFMDKEALKKELMVALEDLTFQAIFITNSRAYHIIPSLKELGYANCCIIGFDLLEQNKKYLQDGDIDFIINQDPIKQGRLGIKTLFSYLFEKQRPDQFNFLPLDIVVKENCDFYH